MSSADRESSSSGFESAEPQGNVKAFTFAANALKSASVIKKTDDFLQSVLLKENGACARAKYSGRRQLNQPYSLIPSAYSPKKGKCEALALGYSSIATPSCTQRQVVLTPRHSCLPSAISLKPFSHRTARFSPTREFSVEATTDSRASSHRRVPTVPKLASGQFLAGCTQQQDSKTKDVLRRRTRSQPQGIYTIAEAKFRSQGTATATEVTLRSKKRIPQ